MMGNEFKFTKMVTELFEDGKSPDKVWDATELTELEKEVVYRFMARRPKWDMTVEALGFLDRLNTDIVTFTAMLKVITDGDQERNSFKSEDFLQCWDKRGRLMPNVQAIKKRLEHKGYADKINNELWGEWRENTL